MKRGYKHSKELLAWRDACIKEYVKVHPEEFPINQDLINEMVAVYSGDLTEKDFENLIKPYGKERHIPTIDQRKDESDHPGLDQKP